MNDTMTYTTRDWERLTEGCVITAYLTYPGTHEAVDRPGPALGSDSRTAGMTWDEATEEVMEKWADAWERLADL